MRVRDFSKTGDAVEIPHLAGLQIESYRWFLQPGCLPEEREPHGLEGIFQEFFPMESLDGALRLEYLGYELGAPAHDGSECRHLSLTYSVPLRARLRVVGPESVEEEVYLAELPRMIGSGEFIINGSERVIVAQVQRSPGVDFGEVAREDGQKLQSCQFIPERGTWIEFGVTRRDLLQVRLGRSGRMPGTWLLRAMICREGSDAEILSLFYPREELSLDPGGGAGAVEGRYLAGDIVNGDTGEVLAEAGARISEKLAGDLRASGMKAVAVLKDVNDPLLLNTLRDDPCKSRTDALLRIYGRFRPGQPATVERAEAFFAQRLADPGSYTLGKVGRFRINRKFGQDVPADRLVLCPEDIINAIKYLMRLRSGSGTTDDIDDLGNRVLRPVGKLLEESLWQGFVRWRRAIRGNLVMGDSGVPSPRSVAATRALVAAVEGFFARSELSQVADQTNPLAALNHVRRISALGPGGLNRKRAGFEVRDVHASHYGRICPIETPEGPNIGLIASLGVFARVNEYGFITTPYRRCTEDGNGPQIRYLAADEERRFRLAPAVKLNGDAGLVARCGGEFMETPRAELDYMDVSPKQIVGVSASLIPFLEHNDANRALMGSNMQRQAVPLLWSEQPIVGTGMEQHVAANSGMVVLARSEGTVTGLDAAHIRIDEKRYELAKFERLNDSTSLNQRPIVHEGQHVKAGQVIADGAATCGGELSLGRNVLVAFMMWDGYNFEDAIIVSDSLVQSDKYTSVHIEEFTCVLRETRMGREEFTCDIPNVSERMLASLDQNGIICVGTKVEAGDILVGKVAPKSKTDLTPEEQLLREIFGKAGVDVSNESLTLPPGSAGVVVDVRHYRRKAHLPDEERSEGRREARRTHAEYDTRIAAAFSAMMRELSALPPAEGASLPQISENASLREMLHHEHCFRFDLSAFAVEAHDQARKMYITCRAGIAHLKAKRDRLLRQRRVGHPLLPGVLEMVKVSVAIKRSLAAGDKMAGRHGNKGVIARIVPHEDMPFLPDGTPVEMILNPLGVPSRMNVGQILETHLGWAGRVLGFKAISPVFDGATEEEIRACLREAGLPEDGKTLLCDGRTGEPFDQKVTVGHLYMMKLNHLVDEKVHARSTGPYSLITQQPLGGKARRGGQRLGEMEVWALQAYGAAHMLQEMLTVKSDDVEGRGAMYESIIKGRNVLRAGMPVSVDVLVREMRGLGLNLQLEKWRGDRPHEMRPEMGPSHGKMPEPAAERR